MPREAGFNKAFNRITFPAPCHLQQLGCTPRILLSKRSSGLRIGDIVPDLFPPAAAALGAGDRRLGVLRPPCRASSIRRSRLDV